MTDETNPGIPEVDELTILKARAKTLGIPFSNNIGLEALKERIAEKIKVSEPETKPAVSEFAKTRMTQRREALKLIRVRIQNLDPKKKDLPGEILTVANEYVGTVRKFIPYGADANANGYHVPQILLDMMKEREFVHITQKKVNGKVVQDARHVKEFNISILPPLTQEELDDLKKAQIAAGTSNVG